MEGWRRNSRQDVVTVDIDALVPKDHMLRKIEKVMDYDWLYERLAPYYNHDNGRPGTYPVVLIKMVLIRHLFGIPSLRQTHRRIQDTLSYRWFLGYKEKCGANEKGQKVFHSHIWQEYLDIVDEIQKNALGKSLYARRKETIERVFADDKEKHAMRYTHHRGLIRVTNRVRLKYAAMNLKKPANWSWNSSFFLQIYSIFIPKYAAPPAFAI